MCRDCYFPVLTWCDVLQAGAVAGWPVLLFVAALLFAVKCKSVSIQFTFNLRKKKTSDPPKYVPEFDQIHWIFLKGNAIFSQLSPVTVPHYKRVTTVSSKEKRNLRFSKWFVFHFITISISSH